MQCNVNVNNKFMEREGTKVSNALECRLQYWANRKVFNWRRKVLVLMLLPGRNATSCLIALH